MIADDRASRIADRKMFCGSTQLPSTAERVVIKSLSTVQTTKLRSAVVKRTGTSAFFIVLTNQSCEAGQLALTQKKTNSMDNLLSVHRISARVLRYCRVEKYKFSK